MENDNSKIIQFPKNMKVKDNVKITDTAIKLHTDLKFAEHLTEGLIVNMIHNMAGFECLCGTGGEYVGAFAALAEGAAGVFMALPELAGSGRGVEFCKGHPLGGGASELCEPRR